jgi:hypothetical protein
MYLYLIVSIVICTMIEEAANGPVGPKIVFLLVRSIQYVST